MSRPTSSDKDSLLETLIGYLAAALTYLHRNPIRYKDIKPKVGRVRALQAPPNSSSEYPRQKPSGSADRLWYQSRLDRGWA